MKAHALGLCWDSYFKTSRLLSILTFDPVRRSSDGREAMALSIRLVSCLESGVMETEFWRGWLADANGRAETGTQDPSDIQGSLVHIGGLTAALVSCELTH